MASTGESASQIVSVLYVGTERRNNITCMACEPVSVPLQSVYDGGSYFVCVLFDRGNFF